MVKYRDTFANNSDFMPTMVKYWETFANNSDFMPTMVKYWETISETSDFMHRLLYTFKVAIEPRKKKNQALKMGYWTQKKLNWAPKIG